MPLPLVYHDDYSPPFPANHRFPMEKFRLLHDHLIASGVTSASELLRPELCPPAILQLAHCPDYIARFLAGDLGHAEQRRLGLPWSPALNRRWPMAWPVTWRAAPITLITPRPPVTASSTTWR